MEMKFILVLLIALNIGVISLAVQCLLVSMYGIAALLMLTACYLLAPVVIGIHDAFDPRRTK